ncbi:HAMP domain-containing histidine kinase [Ruminiclostridium herbifermentans]|uniref:histidine kinase n=1 Tax=Ruminiclostridium herbifermentans TaxID=2488810 RepID=A0A4U7JL63_9FIRM|nr:HAMP domain-containing sensor histidine kinase [Ruminiclostridium herbifermentans]QNU65967.1 HAMP domain-containing histidine kinase [Ruminiclostridium herbifermentans]
MKLLKNKEVQLTFGVLIFLVLLFGTMVIYVFSDFANTINTMQLRQNIAVVGAIAKQYPQIEEEIVSNYTKGFQDNYEYGKKILEKYSYNENLSIDKNSSLQNAYKNAYTKIYIVISIFAIVFLVFITLSFSKIFNKIRRLSVNAEAVIEGKYIIADGDTEEGDIGHLTYQLNTMSERLSETLQALRNEKLFLKKLITDISHQLKTPLASLIMFNDILENDKAMSEQEQRKFLRESKNQLDRMEWLIKNMMKMAKLEARVVEFDKKEALISETIKRSIAGLKLIASEKNISINVSGSNKVTVMHDINWTTEAFSNIIKNSIEHCVYGSEINICWEENNVFVQIVISDNGSGISKEDLPKIFDRFYKGSNSSSPTNIGIGLYITKTIIEGQGGSIYAYSQEGQGVKFIVRLMKLL